MFNVVRNMFQKMNNYCKTQLIYDYEAENKRALIIKPWQIENFFKLIDEDLVEFLKYDKCYRLADNYLIAMVFVYFIRADLPVDDYTVINFLIALYLALAMEEDDEELLQDIENWLESADETLNIFQKHKFFFQQIEYRGAISRSCCENVMRKINPNHEIWKRQRHVNHSGAVRDSKRRRIRCPRCR
ncbi:speedy protein A-like [Leptopilina heterotoma]|uniref:speedy protein A-like n=1 Tax=Leptopilina heterotoma TaxID=63436 RepID=UPI001CA978E7|nr:speedy protein A-like [Leptopilina heterotoma]